VPDEVASGIGAFLDKFWGTEEGKVYFAASKEHRSDQFNQYFAKWPKDRQNVISAMITKSGLGFDVWFCPAIFRHDATQATRENIESVNSHWLDFDGNAPENWEVRAKEVGVPEPSLVVQTSVVNHQQAYWFTDRVTGNENLDKAETITRNLTAAFATDKSGWDLNQLLRVPGTLNYGWYREGEHKPWYSGTPQEASVVYDNPKVTDQVSFEILISAEKQILSKIKIENIPTIDSVLAFGNWTPEMFSWFTMTKEQASEASQYKRSGSLQALAYYGAENGFTDEQIYSILDNADKRWDKYVQRSHAGRDKVFRDTIARARDKFGYLNGDNLTLAGLVGAAGEKVAEPKFIFDYDEFLLQEYVMDWLLDDLIPVAGLGMFTGQPGVGKTRATLQLGLELASGSDRFLHRKNTTGAKKVLFLSLEMTPPQLSEFLKEFSDYYKDQRMVLKRNWHVGAFGESIPFDLPKGQQLVNNLIAQYKPDILIVDSLQAAVSKALTDELAIKSLMQYLATLRTSNNCCVIFVHHERKRTSERVGVYTPSDLSDAYGHQFIFANLDFAVSLSNQGTYVKLDETKNRYRKPINDYTLVSNGIRFVSSEAEGIMNHHGSQADGDSSKPSIGF
jgi:hypothetical protein